VYRRVICALIALAPGRGHADGIAIIGGSPRAIGRAGAATVGDDGGGALLINPAAMARRDTTRVQLGAAVIEDQVSWLSDTRNAPRSSSQAGSSLAPLGAGIGAIGGWIVGVGVMTSGVLDRSLPRPGDVQGDLNDEFDYRYTGIAGSYRRDTLSIGAARRIGSSLALGLSLGASQVRVAEHRRIWAGLDGRDVVGDPAADVDLAMSATARLTPSAVAGVLYAPEDAPIELGASVAWSGIARLDGKVTGTGTAIGPRVDYTGSRAAHLDVRQPITVRAGGRYVGDRIVAELDGDLWIARRGADAAVWSLDGVRVVDPSGVSTDLRRLPSRIAQHTHVAVRTAIDVALMPGFLWATGGYAYANLATPGDRMGPSFGDLCGHTLGLGLEAISGGATISLGWSRTWSLSTRAPSALRLDNPFAVGDGPVPSGRYDGALDQVGILVELELASSP
jgi:hypothetical protein